MPPKKTIKPAVALTTTTSPEAQTIATFINSIHAVKEQAPEIWQTSPDLQEVLSQTDFESVFDTHRFGRETLAVSDNFLIAEKGSFKLPRSMSIYCDPKVQFAVVIFLKSKSADGSKNPNFASWGSRKKGTRCLALIITPSGAPELIWLYQTTTDKPDVVQLVKRGFEQLCKFQSPFIIRAALLGHPSDTSKISVIAERGLGNLDNSSLKIHDIFTLCYSLFKALALVHGAGVIHGDTVPSNWPLFLDVTSQGLPVYYAKLADWDNAHASTDQHSINKDLGNAGYAIASDILKNVFLIKSTDKEYRECSEEVKKLIMEALKATADLARLLVTCKPLTESIISADSAFRLFLEIIQPLREKYPPLEDRLQYFEALAKQQTAELAPITPSSNLMVKSLSQRDKIETTLIPKLKARQQDGAIPKDSNYAPFSINLSSIIKALDLAEQSSIESIIDEPISTKWNTLQYMIYDKNWSMARQLLLQKEISGGHLTFNYNKHTCGLLNFAIEVEERDETHPDWQAVIKLLLQREDVTFNSTLRGSPLTSIIRHHHRNGKTNDYIWEIVPEILARASLQKIVENNKIQLLLSIEQWRKLIQMAVQARKWRITHGILSFCAKDKENFPQILPFAHLELLLEKALEHDNIPRSFIHLLIEKGAKLRSENTAKLLLRLNDIDAIVKVLKDDSLVRFPTAELNQFLLHLLETNAVESLRKILVTGKGLNKPVTINNQRYPIINYAAKQKKWDIVQMLIVAGSDINQPVHYSNGSRCNLIHLAVQNVDIDSLNCLLGRNDLDLSAKSQNSKDSRNETVFDIAQRVKHKNPKLLEILELHQRRSRTIVIPPSAIAAPMSMFDRSHTPDIKYPPRTILPVSQQSRDPHPKTPIMKNILKHADQLPIFYLEPFIDDTEFSKVHHNHSPVFPGTTISPIFQNISISPLLPHSSDKPGSSSSTGTSSHSPLTNKKRKQSPSQFSTSATQSRDSFFKKQGKPKKLKQVPLQTKITELCTLLEELMTSGAQRKSGNFKTFISQQTIAVGRCTTHKMLAEIISNLREPPSKAGLSQFEQSQIAAILDQNELFKNNVTLKQQAIDLTISL